MIFKESSEKILGNICNTLAAIVEMRQELFKFGDKEIDYQYTLTKNRRNEIFSFMFVIMASVS